MRVRVADGATFRYLPHELIPFAGTRYRQRMEVDVAPGGAVALMEVVGPGSSHVPFAYAALSFWTTVHVAGALKVHERFVLTPRTAQQFGEWTHYGSLLAIGLRLCEPVECESGMQQGESALPGGGGVVVKTLGHSAHAVRAALLGRLHHADWLNALLPA
jgi:urease accessory protein